MTILRGVKLHKIINKTIVLNLDLDVMRLCIILAITIIMSTNLILALIKLMLVVQIIAIKITTCAYLLLLAPYLS